MSLSTPPPVLEAPKGTGTHVIFDNEVGNAIVSRKFTTMSLRKVELKF
jgi:hypothetical protein